jgi:hypothetical protein
MIRWFRLRHALCSSIQNQLSTETRPSTERQTAPRKPPAAPVLPKHEERPIPKHEPPPAVRPPKQDQKAPPEKKKE